MRLPNASDATVTESKVRDYILSFSHPQGRHKAAWFGSFGFVAADWTVFADAVRSHAIEHEISAIEETRFGTKYLVEGELHAPDGRQPVVRVIWFIETGEDVPRFVTAYPADQ